MKNRYLAGLIVLLSCSFTAGYSQQPVPVKQQIPDKPPIFVQFPGESDIQITDLRQIIRAATSSTVILPLSSGNYLKGTITEKIQRSPNLVSVNVQLVNYPGALMTISLLTREDRTEKISGRVVHPQAGDVLLLVQDGARYYFEKKQQKYFMTE
jgi:lipoprotein-anchoring transpeptidase ErfK/SrfK